MGFYGVCIVCFYNGNYDLQHRNLYLDKITQKERSKIMSKVKSENTSPEMVVRKLIFSLGYRYRLHDKNLPGKPDLVFPGRKKVIFVHGCFWHMHDCKRGKPPESNKDFWLPKLHHNKMRDADNIRELEKTGWKVLVIWQCRLKKKLELEATIKAFL